jgi:hypothetical protein
MWVIITFDNLVEQHSNGVLGMTQNVRAVCHVDDLPRLRETGLRAQRAADIFRRRVFCEN